MEKETEIKITEVKICCVPNCNRKISKNRKRYGCVTCSKECAKIWKGMSREQKGKLEPLRTRKNKCRCGRLKHHSSKQCIVCFRSNKLKGKTELWKKKN